MVNKKKQLWHTSQYTATLQLHLESNFQLQTLLFGWWVSVLVGPLPEELFLIAGLLNHVCFFAFSKTDSGSIEKAKTKKSKFHWNTHRNILLIKSCVFAVLNYSNYESQKALRIKKNNKQHVYTKSTKNIWKSSKFTKMIFFFACFFAFFLIKCFFFACVFAFCFQGAFFLFFLLLLFRFFALILLVFCVCFALFC